MAETVRKRLGGDQGVSVEQALAKARDLDAWDNETLLRCDEWRRRNTSKDRLSTPHPSVRGRLRDTDPLAILVEECEDEPDYAQEDANKRLERWKKIIENPTLFSSVVMFCGSVQGGLQRAGKENKTEYCQKAIEALTLLLLDVPPTVEELKENSSKEIIEKYTAETLFATACKAYVAKARAVICTLKMCSTMTDTWNLTASQTSIVKRLSAAANHLFCLCEVIPQTTGRSDSSASVTPEFYFACVDMITFLQALESRGYASKCNIAFNHICSHIDARGEYVLAVFFMEGMANQTVASCMRFLVKYPSCFEAFDFLRKFLAETGGYIELSVSMIRGCFEDSRGIELLDLNVKRYDEFLYVFELFSNAIKAHTRLKVGAAEPTFTIQMSNILTNF